MSAGQHDQVAAGREAWERLRSRDRASWQDWLAIARAISIGRSVSLAVAGCNTPFGRKYTRAMAQWLTDNGMAEIGRQVRWRCLQVLDKLPEIERWLATLDENERDRLNHPDSVWLHFQRRGEGAHAPARGHASEGRRQAAGASADSRAASGKAIYWSEYHLRRGAAAYRQCMSRDIFVLVRAVLEGAVRCEGDLLQLLERPTPPSQHRHAAVAVPQLEIHA